MNARALAEKLLHERKAFPIGSLDWDYRTRAAWKLDQLSRGIPTTEWTDMPKENTDEYPH